jgi:single-strand DNA-binding protein
MGSYNRIVLVGNLTADPETKNVGTKNTLLATATLAINNPHKKDDVVFVNFQAWAGLGDIVQKYGHKGDQCLIEGELRIESYDDKDGNKRKSTFVKADTFRVLSSKTKAPAQQPQESAAVL